MLLKFPSSAIQRESHLDNDIFREEKTLHNKREGNPVIRGRIEVVDVWVSHYHCCRNCP